MDFQDNLKTEIINISKVTKILEKGKVIRFKVVVISGNYKNVIGLGVGKDLNFHTAKKKAIESSYKNLIYVNHYKRNNVNCLPSVFIIKFKKNKVYFKPNDYNTGIRSSKLFFILLNMAGFSQVLVKRLGSKNLMNNIYSFFLFLKKFNDGNYKKN